MTEKTGICEAKLLDIFEDPRKTGPMNRSNQRDPWNPAIYAKAFLKTREFQNRSNSMPWEQEPIKISLTPEWDPIQEPQRRNNDKSNSTSETQSPRMPLRESGIKWNALTRVSLRTRRRQSKNIRTVTHQNSQHKSPFLAILPNESISDLKEKRRFSLTDVDVSNCVDGD